MTGAWNNHDASALVAAISCTLFGHLRGMLSFDSGRSGPKILQAVHIDSARDDPLVSLGEADWFIKVIRVGSLRG